jgi:hypothetical protein
VTTTVPVSWIYSRRLPYCATNIPGYLREFPTLDGDYQGNNRKRKAIVRQAIGSRGRRYGRVQLPKLVWMVLGVGGK